MSYDSGGAPVHLLAQPGRHGSDGTSLKEAGKDEEDEEAEEDDGSTRADGKSSRRRLRARHSFTSGQRASPRGSSQTPAQELGRALFGMCPTGRENELTLRLMADCTTVTRDWRPLLSPSEQYGGNLDFEPLGADDNTDNTGGSSVQSCG
jgi:hypothetical protein